MRRLFIYIGLCLTAGLGYALAQQATGVNPPVGSVWTYLGPTYGAAWMPSSSIPLSQPSVVPPNFWITPAPPAVINRINDRLLVGGEASKYNAASEGGAVHSWIGTSNSAAFSYMETYAQMVAASTRGQIGALFASRTSDTPAPHTGSAIPLAIYGDNDRTSRQDVQWGLYSTLVRQSGAGSVINEFDIANRGSNVVLSPYTGALPGLTADLWLGCGGEVAQVVGATNPCSAAIGILNNGAPFNKGIVFLNTSLGPDGTTATAIDMPRRHQIVWETPNGPGAVIRSDILDSALYPTTYLLFSQTPTTPQVEIQLAGQGTFQFQTLTGGVGTVVNSLQFSAAQGGQNPAISVAAGGDTNISLHLIPKGTGNIVIGGNSLVVGNMPTTCTGKPAGTLWKNGLVVNICP